MDAKGGLFDFVPGSVNVRLGYVPGTSGDNSGVLTFLTGSGTERARIDASGNVGIGTTDPTTLGGGSKLTVNQGADGNIVFARGGSTRQVQLGTSSTMGYINADNASGGLGFNVNGSERARIDSSGNLLVGTTTAHGKLSAEADNVTLGIQTNFGTPSNADAIQSKNNVGTVTFKVLANGDVQNSNNSYGSISDFKLKENIADATPKLDKLNQVRVVNYNLLGEEHKQLGVIAQELEQIFPGMVEETADKDAEGNDIGTTTKSVKYSVFVPMLIKAVQELTAKVASLEAQLNP